jgi:chloride channel protein, CIC family
MPWLTRHPLLQRSFPQRVREDLSVTYTRSLQKWLLISPLMGLVIGAAISLVAWVILHEMWPRVMAQYLAHHWLIIPGLTVSMAVTGLIMQYTVSNPDQHSTEEVIDAYHNNHAIDMRTFPQKLLASATTVGLGGSSALEGPSIYGGAALGTWLWNLLSRRRLLRLTPRDRRIMLICGAAAGMSAVFRAPLTGIVFALEMPYKDDLAHEAVLPSLIASVVSYLTLGALLGNEVLFDFPTARDYTLRDLAWCALLGVIVGVVAMVFGISFRRLRRFVVRWKQPHWVKLTVGGFLTGCIGLLFLWIFPGDMVPLGANYEVVRSILNDAHSSAELLTFTVFKLFATAATLGFGGVGAMFVPMFLSGGCIGTAFAQSLVHTPVVGMYAAVGMAAFIAAAYKTPLASVVFVAEATGGHGFIIPALIGAAVAYTISGDASISSDQQMREARAEALDERIEGASIH